MRHGKVFIACIAAWVPAAVVAPRAHATGRLARLLPVDDMREAYVSESLAANLGLRERRLAIDEREAAEDAAVTIRTAIASTDARVVGVRFKAGAAASVELVEARTALTRAELDQVIATYDFAVALVELDRLAAPTPEVNP